LKLSIFEAFFSESLATENLMVNTAKIQYLVGEF